MSLLGVQQRVYYRRSTKPPNSEFGNLGCLYSNWSFQYSASNVENVLRRIYSAHLHHIIGPFLNTKKSTRNVKIKLD